MKAIEDGLRKCLSDGDALIIVPPFAQVNYAHLGAHMLQASALEAGFRVRVLYANILWASTIGYDRYQMFMAYAIVLLGERSFARAAFDAEPWGRNADRIFDELNNLDSTGKRGLASAKITPEAVARLADIEGLAPPWADAVAEAISRYSYKVVGATTSVEQIATSVALLKRVKALRPDVTAILGGANCAGCMAEQVAALDPAIDFVFSGECDTAFPEFLKNLRAGVTPDDRILRTDPISYLDNLPTPRFDEFFQQHEQFLASKGMGTPPNQMPYESSRGCWWGQKHQCTFCGINGLGLVYREKTHDRVLDEMRQLRDAHGNLAFAMSDAIMPWSYRKTLLPRLANEDPRFRIAYEEKANLSLKDVMLLKSAGVYWIVPGVEALSTGLLKLMNKGVLARQNIALLRYSRLCSVSLTWNLLLGFPGDQLEDYEQTLRLLPLLHHLQPPTAAYPFLVTRFSPYFDEPERYGITSIRPLQSYEDVYPDHVDVMSLAYHFEADFETCDRRYPDLRRKLEEAVEEWQKCWDAGFRSSAVLRATEMDGAMVMVRDTRGLDGTEEYQVLPRDQAIDVLTQQPYDPASDIQMWAVEKRLGVIVDDCYVPLATASPELLLRYEAEAREKNSMAARPALVAGE